jgi:sulfoxide reductase heme-binding subunit YedZ
MASRVDTWMTGSVSLSIRRQELALALLRLPAFVPLLFIARGWLQLNAREVLTNNEANVLGTGGEICFFVMLSITPIITLTGARWIAPLRRWYGIMFAVIGISDAITASITGDFAGGVFGRVAGHTFLLAGLLLILLALPLLATANTFAQRRLGRYWKRLHKVTYLLWALLVFHLLLLDGYVPFGASGGDGIPVFHQRFYQAVAISIPLLVLRLPGVRRWIAARRADGQQARVWLAVAPLAALYLAGLTFIINEEIFTGTMALALRSPAN